jgi:hypothetical protein
MMNVQVGTLMGFFRELLKTLNLLKPKGSGIYMLEWVTCAGDIAKGSTTILV